MSVYKKLQQARVALQAKQLKKSGKNTFAGYDYFELEDFLPAAQIIFNELGLCGTIDFPERAVLRICDTEKPDDAITFTCPIERASLKGCHEVQNLGASMKYIRRYLWVNALEIVEHDALDATTGKEGKGKGVHKPADNPDFQPDADEETFLLSIFDSVVAVHPDFAAAHAILEEAKLDADERVWVWNKLGAYSALRSGIKKYAAQMKVQAQQKAQACVTPA